LWDIPTMTVIADSKKRVTLPAKPGERFDVQVVREGQIVLTRLEPVRSRPAKVTVRKVGGRYSVGRVDRPISEAALREALAEFP
jgi:exosome complex RNA-binding protein Csl4